jgi:hypothetical protein
MQRRRHQAFRFAAGIAEHNSLIARPFVLIVFGIDALSDMGRLGMEQHFDIGALPMKAVLLIADIADGKARSIDNDFFADLLRPASLARNHDPIGRRQGFAGDPQIPGIPAVFRP